MNLCDSVIVWINNLSPLFVGEFLSGHIELLAAPCGLLCVWLAIRQNIWCYPVGLVQAALYIWIFLHAGLYSNTILNVIFVALQVNGWVHWRRSDLKTDTLRVSRLGRSGIVACTAVGLLGTIIVGSFMNAFTDTALPVWDAAILVLSLIAQFLFARKILENWLLWIGVDVLAIGGLCDEPLIRDHRIILSISVHGSCRVDRMAAEYPKRAGADAFRRSKGLVLAGCMFPSVSINSRIGYKAGRM